MLPSGRELPLRHREFGSRRGAVQERTIGGDIVASHPRDSETRLEFLSNGGSAHRCSLPHGGYGGFQRIDDHAADVIGDDLRNRAIAPGDNRRTGRHGFDHHQPERLWPVDRKQKRPRFSEKWAFLALVDLADELDERMIEQRFDLSLEKCKIRDIDLGRYLQGIPARLAISMARSGRFSGEMRPRNAK